jgi:hypothetical protein
MSGIFLILAWSLSGLAGDTKPPEKWSDGLGALKIESAVVVADLDGVPGLVKGIVRRGVVDKHRTLDRQTAESLSLLGRTFPTRDRTLTLLDWDGAFARELGVSGMTEKTYHAYVVDRSGRLVAHITQAKGDGSERGNIGKAMKALATLHGAGQGHSKVWRPRASSLITRGETSYPMIAESGERGPGPFFGQLLDPFSFSDPSLRLIMPPNRLHSPSPTSESRISPRFISSRLEDLPSVL